LIWAATAGDIDEIQRLESLGTDLNTADYDGRTAIHLAASEGRTDVVKYFIGKKINLAPKDRWGGTPLMDAKKGRHKEVVILLENAILPD